MNMARNSGFTKDGTTDMKKLIYLLLCFCLLSHMAVAQSDWIDFNRNYYKFFTSEDGIYRLSFTSFSASGLNPASIDPRHIRLFHRGVEVPIYIQGEQDGRFDASDFLEFFGKKNDGTLDKGLFADPAHVGNPLYNIHSDSIAYFLTVTPGVFGKRMPIATPAPASGPTLTAYPTSRLNLYADQYNLGREYNPGVRLSEFEEGEGWMSAPIPKNTPRVISIIGLGDIPAGSTATLEIGLAGRSENPHLSVISVGQNTNSLRQVATVAYQDFQVLQEHITIAATDFNSDGSIAVRVASAGPEAIDNVSISFIRLKYSKNIPNTDFLQEVVFLQQGDILQVSNVNGNYLGMEVSDKDNPVRIPVSKTGNQIRIQGVQNGAESTIWLQNLQTVKEINVMQLVRFRNLMSRTADYIILTHRNLRRPSATYGDPVLAYAAHRASAAGGGYDTLVVNIDELYNQFSFGEKTPLAIFDFLKAYYPIHKPTYMLMVGRAMGIFSSTRVNNINYFYRQRPSAFQFQDLLPPAGYPYADNNFAIGLDPAFPDIPAIAIGRIPARTPNEVVQYLDKVKEKDALGIVDEWQKNIIHLSGGVTAFELSRYFTFLNGFKAIAEGPYLGGDVTTYRKRSNSSIELIDISGDVNKGVNLITFFGHGAPSIIDIEIGFASDPTMGYNNKGKYPMLLLNGCDAGNAFGNAYTFGEDWILAPNKGASNFMAHSATGVDVFLRRYSESFYTAAFADSALIYQPVGLVKNEAEKLFYGRYGNSIVHRAHAEQLVMLGDPAVRLFPAPLADYAIKESEVLLESFDGNAVNALSDSLKLSFVLRNLGRVDMDSLNFRISRRLSDGTVINYPQARMAAVFRKDTIEFAIPNTGVAAFGENLFTIEINPSREIRELTYANNVVSAMRFIPLSGTMHLIPQAYGIVNERQIELIAQIPGKSVEPRNLILQLDTSADFSSSTRQEARITTANLARWQVNLFQQVAEKDSVTFYWRSRFLEPKEGENQDWTRGSFSYIRNSEEGWTQRAMPQLLENQLTNLEQNKETKEWKFNDINLKVGVFTFGAEADSLTFRNAQFYLEGVPYILDNVNNANSRLCPNGSLGLVAFDQRSLTPYLAIPVNGFDILDNRSCGRVPQVIQSIRNAWITTPGQRLLLDYIDALKEGDYVVVFSVGNVTFEQWPDEAFLKMKSIGANEAVLRNLKSGDPYILFGRKGMKPGEAVEIVGKQQSELAPNEQVLEFETDLVGYFTAGSILTPRIGPSSEWKHFFNHVKKRNWFDEELAYFDVIGVRPNGDEQVLLSNVQEHEVDLGSIDSRLFPYLRLRYAMDDENATAPAQLDKWQVNFKGVPEGVLIFKNREEQMNVKEGQQVALRFEFLNISKMDFSDSITVNWQFNNITQRKLEQHTLKIPAVAAGEGHSFEIIFNATGKAGQNRVEVQANPRILPEQTYRNNIVDLGIYFNVEADNSTAILDVNFDGVYIMDGDIVSPTVLISALLKNDRTLILKNDTLGIELFLKQQCDNCQFSRINFSDPRVVWSPATENSSYKVELRPGPLADGMYTFRVVTANLGVDKPYEVNFEVVNESSITNFYPYPNPFSTSVRFVFTITGSDVPDQIKIQIMSVTGRVVREILQDELGPLRIGNNISEYAWDGKDEYGDQLANGVYIYRVLVRKQGAFVEARATAADKAFKQGYGKMYLLR